MRYERVRKKIETVAKNVMEGGKKKKRKKKANQCRSYI